MDDKRFKEEYQNAWLYAWNTMKQGMKCSDKESRLEVWNQAKEHYNKCYHDCYPEFGGALLDVVKLELLDTLDRLNIDDPMFDRVVVRS